MAPKKATTVNEVVLLLHQRMVEGKDRTRKATKAEQKFFLSDVRKGVERQGAGFGEVQIFRGADGTWYVDHLDWSHAMRWHPFNINAVNSLDIRNLMDHFSQTIDKQWWATAPLETLLRESLSGKELLTSTYECILELQREGTFEGLRHHILDKCPHLANLFHEQTGPEQGLVITVASRLAMLEDLDREGATAELFRQKPEIAELDGLELKPPLAGAKGAGVAANQAPPLAEREQQVFDIITEQPDGHGITGRRIIEQIRKRHDHSLSQGTLTGHIIPKLTQWYGVRNRPRAGYHREQC